MKVLVIGSGGREHALCHKLSESKRVSKIYCAPGNGGTLQVAENVNINPKDIDLLLDFAINKDIDLTVVGPEDPLVNGIVDRFNEKGLKIFGPNKKGAILEGSKIISKGFMEKYNIPTGKYKVFKEAKAAISFLDSLNYPIVIKADGLCAGKGVIICKTKEEGIKAIEDIMVDKKFGLSGEEILIEEFLEGTETSLLCFVSNENIIPMESARDYKKIFEGDKGPNTGGVGCFSPNPVMTDKLKEEIEKSILKNIKIGFKNEDIDFRGILFIGLMLTADGPKVLEFNVRFGDPETEVVLPRLENDIVDIFEKTMDGSLKEEDLKWTDKKCVTVVLTSKGYPVEYEKGKEITENEELDKDIILFHNGTKVEDGKLLTNGGRVLSVTALGDTLKEAREKVYKNIDKIKCDDLCYRKDIGII
ncbi:phosphoribosylamine--glycine ligase [Anaerosalibacter bizertensis]|uniref:Phosphoribosylamine--glycine ligase n=1 Tax=Anaerosalibacter bizertensis TaxID=932217 RepID=A0A9Q4AAR5_9FIRM|nr:phosphoribosylamine--glycine ligase [Anaerosalibacter bizertensis]MBV1819384.1 phosphoribosylamine--glycine ligase [Bacteroidales bacterium MSK.15.36]MCB5558844.1 phosphoribosylamine--glycine ligase [Anaerosalibacter bizertensis]MCG4564150.1 phosphoribosylamine--glycine ligase [Anaerosalibacter bizertensis]